MQRRGRSRSKVMVQQNDHRQKRKNHSKGQKMQEQISPSERIKLLKENFLISLANVFLENKNDPSLIYPWMKDFRQLQEKIIGRNYIIQGPSQSGKYSSVKYAIQQNHPGIYEILINCDVSTTQHQIYQRIIEEFAEKCKKKCRWPVNQQKTRIFSPEDIDFKKLNPYLIQGNVQFVIVIRNAEHLFGFKNQSILYNLFEWMKSQQISQRGGLVLISRQLRLTDKFQKRVKSRFCGTRLCVFRPQKAEIYTKIITKRIQAVIKDKQIWLQQNKMFLNENQIKIQEDIYNSDDDINMKGKKRGRTPKKGNHQQKSITFQDIIENKDKSQYMKQMDEYVTSLQKFLSLDVFYALQINNQMIQTVVQIEKIKSKKKGSEIFSQESLLKPEQQIECLKKLKVVFENNKQLEGFLQQQIMKNQIITIPFVLMVLQHVFIRLDEILIKNLSIEKLRRLVVILFQKNVQYQFPTHDIEGNSLENLNNVDIMFLTLIYKYINEHRPSVKLMAIYNQYKGMINTQVNESYSRSTTTLPILLIERSIQNLWRNRIITYDLYNLWNSQIKLIYSLAKTKLGLQMVASRIEITQFMKSLFQQANIKADYKLKKKHQK